MSSSLPQVGLTSGPGAEWEQDHEEGLLPLQGDHLLQMANGSFGESGEAEASTLLQVPVRRGNQGLGLVVDDQNIITELTAGGQAEQEGQLAVGDLVVAVDGLPMYDVQQGTRRLKDVLSTMPVKEEHRFSVRRAINTAVTLD